MGQELYQKATALQFYEDRYEGGYMEEWPREKKQRVFEVIRSLSLPKTGIALDFGCGNGVFTEVLRQALPEWEIYGCDISRLAIENAQQRFPECSFFVSDNEVVTGLAFDFLFSHHVLEHVFDIQKTARELNDLLKPNACMLHVFPCGNEGSLEQKVCAMRTDGVDAQMENRFFFEDEGHVRRMTTDDMNRLVEPFGFKLELDYYSNQYFGAIKWISQYSPRFIFNFTDARKGRDATSRRFLKALRRKLLFLYVLQMPSTLYHGYRLTRPRRPMVTLKMACVWVPNLVSLPFYAVVNALAAREWKQSGRQPNGSEMYVFYRR